VNIHLSPDAAILCLTLGVLLIYWELNRPGAILPGAIGLLAVLFSIAALLRVQLQPAGIVLIAIASILLALGLRHILPTILPIAATIALILGLYLVIHPKANRIHAATSLFCGLTLATASSQLAAIARRARRNKGLD
jgi:membrane-bound serine protease (ClpP class)